ncbi:YaiO family outer membrane beta-barrel protein [Luteimonas deserti]|uniref:YaiO family outer membrane beta-barrel protein n=1 Tax=Luteimonas deserti TaxID=2752306 RepID=A0A7Z0QQH5_9GAMM|nr:YaiO family outer membrane beta-barrel protein [Luteimonas deserti]NYZ61875.1 YaiO family outer membrane beta-barrel protein [Luteimonas deserti]
MSAGRLLLPLLLAVMVTRVSAQETDPVEARIVAEDYAGAETLLRARLVEAPGDDRTRFQLARVLAWQQRADEAVPLYQALLEREPDNADYLFGLAQAQLWSGDSAGGRAGVTRLERLAPAHPGLDGLRRQAAPPVPAGGGLAQARAATPRTREVGYAFRYDRLTRDLAAWRGERIDIGGRDSDGRAWYAAAAREQRFGLSDTGIEAGVALPLASRWALQLDGGGWPGSDFQPRWFGDMRLQYAFDGGTVLASSLRRTRYPDVTVERLALAVEQYWGDWRLGYTFNRTDVAGNRVSGHDVALDRYYRDRDSIGLRLTSGSEDALQGTDVVATEVRALGLQGRHGFADDWALQWGVGYVRQGAFYDRRWVQLGLRRAF